MLEEYFGTIVGMLAASLVVTGWVNTQFLITAATWIKRVTSWVIPIALAFIGKALNLGMFETMTILWTAINGFGIALAANGVFDIEFIQKLLTLIGARKKESVGK